MSRELPPTASGPPGERTPGPALSTTSFAILSLLAIKPWSTYELAQQMGRSVGRIWPRAQSKIYEEPKKLVVHGLATVSRDSVGRRPRSVYAITPPGRVALADWLQKPGAGPVLEWEQLLQIGFAENGSRDDALRTLAATGEWARERNAENLAVALGYLADDGEFPGRVAQSVLVGRFLTDYYRMVAEWAEWASASVRSWPQDPHQAVPDRAQLEEIARRARWSERTDTQRTAADPPRR